MDSMDMLFRGPWGAFYFLSSFCTSVDPTCYYLYLRSMAKWLLKDSDAISIFILVASILLCNSILQLYVSQLLCL